MVRGDVLQRDLVLLVHLVLEFYIGRNDANTEGRKPLYRVYKVGPVKLYTVISILRFQSLSVGSASGDLEGIQGKCVASYLVSLSHVRVGL